MTSQQWYYRKGAARFGPVSTNEIVALIARKKLEASDLLRGVGMTQWTPVSDVAEFRESLADIKPNSDPELGLATKAEPPETMHAGSAIPEKSIDKRPSPAKKAQTPADIQLPSAQKVAQNSSVTKPVAVKAASPSKSSVIHPKTTPKAPSPIAPPAVKPPASIPTSQTSGQEVNPFASFGMEPAAPVSNDPFAALSAGLGGGAGGPDPFANLVALEKQGQAIYREPVAPLEPEQENAGKKKSDSSSAGFGPGGTIGILLAPFLGMFVLAFPCGAIYAVAHLFVFGIMAFVFSILISIMMSSGVAKMVGFGAGGCLLKAKIKNEILSLGYGGLLGMFGVYVFMAGYIWGMLFFNPFQGMYTEDKPPIVELTEEEEKGEIELDLFGGEGDAFDALDEYNAKRKEKDRRESKKEAGVLAAFNKPISVFAALLPGWVLAGFIISWWFWLIHGVIIFCGTAHSTWMSNLGHDPTRG